MCRASLHSQLRKPGARESARYVEVGGSGGNGRMATAAPGPGDGELFSGGGWRSLSVTCILRQIPPQARALTGGRESKQRKSGVKR